MEIILKPPVSYYRGSFSVTNNQFIEIYFGPWDYFQLSSAEYVASDEE
jgi:hypothetical protein